MKKYTEISFFILINTILSNALLLSYLIFKITENLIPFHESYRVLDNAGVYSAIFIGIILIITTWFIKLNIFNFLYSRKNVFTNLHVFFEKFLKEKNFRDKIFFSILIFDIAIFILSSLKYDLIFILPLNFILGGGILISYISFYLSNQ